jgi:hypothetical protein
MDLGSVFFNEYDHKRYFAATERHDPTAVYVTLVVETNLFGGPRNFKRPAARFLWKPDADAKEMHDGVVETLTHLPRTEWPALEAKVNRRQS